MSLRVGFDVDGVVADFHTAFAPLPRRDQESAVRRRATRSTRRVKLHWERIDRTRNGGSHSPIRADQFSACTGRRGARWEVYFLNEAFERR